MSFPGCTPGSHCESLTIHHDEVCSLVSTADFGARSAAPRESGHGASASDSRARAGLVSDPALPPATVPIEVRARSAARARLAPRSAAAVRVVRPRLHGDIESRAPRGPRPGPGRDRGEHAAPRRGYGAGLPPPHAARRRGLGGPRPCHRGRDRRAAGSRRGGRRPEHGTRRGGYASRPSGRVAATTTFSRSAPDCAWSTARRWRRRSAWT